MLWRTFYQQFPGVKVFRIDGALCFKRWRICPDYDLIAPTFLRDDEGSGAALDFLPALEEIQLDQDPVSESQRETKLGVFRPFVLARQQAGRPVRIFFCL